MFEGMLTFAIIIGLITGAYCARPEDRPPWEVLSILSIIALLATFWRPILGVFAIPALISMSVLSSILYLVEGGLFKPRAVQPPRRSMNDLSMNSASSSTPSVLRWIAVTFLFWITISLANVHLLTIAPAIILLPEIIKNFLPFLIPPLLFALVVGVGATVLVVKCRLMSGYMAPFIFNICVLLTFGASAEVFKDYLMSQSLLEHKPEHFESTSFLHSLRTYHPYYCPSPHARFTENNKTYFWSYSERKFVQIN